MEVDRKGHRLALVLLVLAVLLAPQPATADQFRIVSQNLNRLFDDVDDGNDAPVVPTRQYRQRLARTAARLTPVSDLPHVIALQEIENRAVLQKLADAIQRRHGVTYRPIMAQNPAFSTLNTGYLVHPRLSVRRVEALFARQRVGNGGGRLFSRPPLQLDTCLYQRCVTIINLHQRSMRGIDSAHDGKRVAARRRQQAVAMAAWIDRQQRDDPAIALVVLGDFNALTPSDRHVDVAGIIRGAPNDAATRLDSPDLVARDLVDLTRRIPRQRRYSYIYRGRKQQLDYLFASQAMARRTVQVRYDRIDYALSDHAALRASFHWH